MKNPIFSVEKSQDSLGFLLWKIMTLWQREIKKALDPFDITHPQFVILAITLWHTLHDREVTQSILIQESKLDKMTVSISIKKLVAQSYLKHQIHAVDTRAKKVELTPKGRALSKKIVPLIESVDQDFFNPLTEKKRSEFISIFRMLSCECE